MNNSKNVMLRGYVSGNLGDDLFFYIICNRYKNAKFTLHGKDKFKESLNGIENLNYVSFDKESLYQLHRVKSLTSKIYNKVANKLHMPYMHFIPYHEYLVLKGMNKADANVLISGSFYMDLSDDCSVLENRLYLEDKYYKSAPYVLGINFGPYKHEEYLNKMSDNFKKASVVSFRDNYSKELFDLDNIRYCPDIVFNLDMKPAVHKDVILINVMNIAKDNSPLVSLSDIYINKMIELVNYLKSQNEKVVLLSMCDAQGDHNIVKHIASVCGDVETVLYPDKGIKECVELFEKSKMVITTRYHGMILGWMAKAITLPVVYSEKMMHVIEDTAPSIDYCHLEDIESFDFIDYYNKHKDDLAINVDRIIENARVHFKELDELL